jgi:uncharacterized protein (DUF1800 family)
VTATAWKPYRPTPAAPWDLRRVAHLHRRAGFAATWSELQRDLRDGPDPSLDRLLSGRAREGAVPEGYDGRAGRLDEVALAGNRPDELRAAWVFRMLYGPDPLGERLALMWHNHFATSNAKVNEFHAMARQNALFREHGRAPFGELLGRVARDPALLAWLDAPLNRPEHPNENLARELMELFTLGVGQYTEADVKEAARALTGWRFTSDALADGEQRALRGARLERVLTYDAGRHDGGEKAILGRRGPWTGEDLVRQLLDHPATTERLAWRITSEFLGEGAAGREEVAGLASRLRDSGLDVGEAVATVLRSERFFAEATVRARVPGPVEWAVAAARRFLPLEPAPSPTKLGRWAARMGQSLYYPPNVGGWPGGRAWLSPLALLGRANLAADLVSGRMAAPAGPPLDVTGLARRHGRGGSREEVVGFLTDLILGGSPDAGWSDRVQAACTDSPDDATFARRAAITVLSSPEAQLG